MHHADAVGQRERFFLVVRDEDRRDAELALDLADGPPQFLADLGVERAEGLVHQQHLRPVRQRARHGDALLLAARELRRQAVVHALERDQPQQLLAARAALRAPSPCARAARTRCCRRRSCGGTARSAGRRSRPRARARTRASRRWPCRKTRPWSISVRPAMARSSVLLPLPLGPSSTRNSPCSTLSETSLTTGIA